MSRNPRLHPESKSKKSSSTKTTKASSKGTLPSTPTDSTSKWGPKRPRTRRPRLLPQVRLPLLVAALDESLRAYGSQDGNDSMGLDVPLVTEIQDGQGQGESGRPRKNNREIAAERRQANPDRYKAYQDKAEAAMKNRNLIQLKTKPLSQLKDALT